MSSAVVTDLLAAPDLLEARRLLEARSQELDDATAEELKQQADHFLREDLQRSLAITEILFHHAQLSRKPSHRALALLAKANALTIGQAQHAAAVDLYNEAADLYAAAGRPVDQAKSQIGKLYALASMGRQREAIEVGQKAAEVLEEQGEWLLLGKLTLNLGTVRGRMGEDSGALSQFDRATDLFTLAGDDGEPFQPLVDYGRALALRNLGRFQEAIQAGESSIGRLIGTDQRIDIARARQALAMTFYAVGRYNEALQLLDQVRRAFAEDGRDRDAVLATVFVTDCLLELRRFPDVLEMCTEARSLFSRLGTQLEVGQAWINEAVAQAALGRISEAKISMGKASAIFSAEENASWAALSDLELAAILLRCGDFEAAEKAARRSQRRFRSLGLSHRESHAKLLAAQAMNGRGKSSVARQWVTEVLEAIEAQELPTLKFHAHLYLGRDAADQGRLEQAGQEFRSAMEQLERVRSRLMVEFRSDFLEDKQQVYEEMVRLLLDQEKAAEALEYAERAKSRSLFEILSYRPHLEISARRSDDEPLVQEISRLRVERDRVYRRREDRGDLEEQAGEVTNDERIRTRQDVLGLEKQISSLWHELLIRNADYAREASVWLVRWEPVNGHLDGQTAIVEYFLAGGEWIAFVLTRHGTHSQKLPVRTGEVHDLLQRLRLNLAAVPTATSSSLPPLVDNARSLLRNMYTILLAPLAGELVAFERFIFVPHGLLHYFPLHALHDGEQYLVEGREVSYLPSSGLLSLAAPPAAVGSGALAVGHSWAGRLRHAHEEASAVALALGGETLIEEQATVEAVRAGMEGKRVVHIAAHGEFRPDQPLFSGIQLADGELTALDTFGLRLNASLVTLSACQSGQNVIGGGDELVGLMRAWLYAGARSLVLSLWQVDDESSAILTKDFYSNLASGESKSSALGHAQRHILDAGGRFAHPYYWAPYVLIGDHGSL